jgi:hypothetical protein
MIGIAGHAGRLSPWLGRFRVNDFDFAIAFRSGVRAVR